MFLFFGTRQRRRALGTGWFACPYCFEQRPFEHLETRTWFHLFWVPLAPLGSPQEVVRCGVCGGQWGPAVLGARPVTPQDGPQDTPPAAPYGTPYGTPQD